MQGWELRERRRQEGLTLDAVARAAGTAESNLSASERGVKVPSDDDGVEPPAWSRGHALPEFWFVGSLPELQAYAFGYSPFSLQVRGVMIDPSDLEPV